jgi:hypothetical protein
VEHACDGASAGRGSSAVDATRQTHQRRLPHRSLNPAHKHHGAGAGAGDDALDAAPVGIIRTIFISTTNQRTIALATADSGPGGGQKAGCAQTDPHSGAGSAGTGGTGSRSGCARACSLGGERLILPKASGDR